MRNNAILVIGFVLGLALPQLEAQTTLGTIRGVVEDPSGAAVPDVRVTATNQETNLSGTAATDESGNYEIRGLLPGVYKVVTEAPGFKRFVRENVTLPTAGTVRVDVTLEIGAVTAEVTVSESTVSLETERADIYTFRDSRQIQDLPFNIRTNDRGTGDSGIHGILTHSAGAASQGDNVAGMSFSGARTGQQSLLIEGVEISAPTSGWFMMHMVPALEAIQEVKVNTSKFDAQYANAATVEVLTKAGGNRFHGSLFYYHSNGRLNARAFFSSWDPVYAINSFGSSLSGPIVRNKTFFFMTYEGQRNRAPWTVVATVPTMLMRKGDFSQIGTPIIDPLTGEPFPNNVIPPERQDSVALKLTERYYPLPNYGAPDTLSNNYRKTFPNAVNNDESAVRIDHRISDRNLLFGRFGTKRTWKSRPQGRLPTIGLLDQVRWPRWLALSDSHTFTPNLINEARYSYSFEHNRFGPEQIGYEALTYLGIKGLPPDVPKDTRGFPQFRISGFTTPSSWGDGNWRYATHDFTDYVSWIRGRHSMRFGAELTRRATNSFGVWDGHYGRFRYDGSMTGFAWADLLLGLPRSTNRYTPPVDMWTKNWDFAFFVQDDFKVTPRLTLNLGLRYQLQTQYRNDLNQATGFHLESGSVIVSNQAALDAAHLLFPMEKINVVTAAEVGLPESLYFRDTNNFAPRIGIAYRPLARDFVIRAGYGWFYDILGSSVAPGREPFFGVAESFTNQIVDGKPLFRMPEPFLPLGQVGYSLSLSPRNPSFVNPYSQQWNLTIEKAVWSTVIRAAYVGRKASKLLYTRNINRPPASDIPFSQERRPYPKYQDIRWSENGGNLTYHSLQIDAQRRMLSGLSYQVSYTWAKALADVQDNSRPTGPEIEDPYNRMREKGNVVYIPRHRFTSNLIYELPFGAGKRYWTDGALSKIFGGMEISAIAVAQSGLYFTPSFSGSDPSNTNQWGGRPDRLRDGNLPPGQRTIDHWFDVSAFAAPTAGFGNAGVGILEGPGIWSVSLGVFKKFVLFERVNMRFEATAANVFNHPNFQNPAANITWPNAGRISRTWGASDQAFPRTIRFGLRFDF